jgi:hypothetical protein
MSRLTDEQHQIHIAIVFFFMLMFAAMHSICADALAIKELNSPSTMGLIKEIMITAGEIVASLVFMKLVSMDFARKAFGRN